MEKKLESEFVYAVGLSPDDKERLSRVLGVHCLDLSEYENVNNQIEGMELDT